MISRLPLRAAVGALALDPLDDNCRNRPARADTYRARAQLFFEPLDFGWRVTGRAILVLVGCFHGHSH